MGESQKWVENLIYAYADRLSREIQLVKVIVFGSRARGDFKDSSDLDLLVLSPDFKGMYLEDRCRLLLKHWGRKNYLKLRLNPYGYTPQEYEESKKYDPLIRKALRDGIVELKFR